MSAPGESSTKKSEWANTDVFTSSRDVNFAVPRAFMRSYQGYGIGPRLSDAVAQKFLDQGKRYNSRTAHPRLGAYRGDTPRNP